MTRGEFGGRAHIEHHEVRVFPLEAREQVGLAQGFGAGRLRRVVRECRGHDARGTQQHDG